MREWSANVHQSINGYKRNEVLLHAATGTLKRCLVKRKLEKARHPEVTCHLILFMQSNKYGQVYKKRS